MKWIGWRICSVILLLGWMAVIFLFSAKTGSQSAGISQKIADALFSIPGVSNFCKLEQLHTFIRKLAHATEYGILAGLMLMVCQCWDVDKMLFFARYPVRMYGTIWILTVLYAASDEFHQKFVDGRSASVKDVCIDAAGAWMVLAICYYAQARVGVKKNVDKM